jgi:hypothetical protein
MADSEDAMREAAEIQPRYRDDEQKRLASKGIASGIQSVKNADFEAKRKQKAGL